MFTGVKLTLADRIRFISDNNMPGYFGSASLALQCCIPLPDLCHSEGMRRSPEHTSLSGELTLDSVPFSGSMALMFVTASRDIALLWSFLLVTRTWKAYHCTVISWKILQLLRKRMKIKRKIKDQPLNDHHVGVMPKMLVGELRMSQHKGRDFVVL